MAITSERNVGFERFQKETKDQIPNYENDILNIEKLERKADEQGRTNLTESEKINRCRAKDTKQMNKQEHKEQKDMT